MNFWMINFISLLQFHDLLSLNKGLRKVNIAMMKELCVRIIEKDVVQSDL